MSTNDGPGVPPEQSPERTSVFRADFLAEVEGAEAPAQEPAVAGVDALPAGSALLVVKRGPNAGSRFLLDRDTTSAGRHPGSLNGTYVNREPVDQAVLANGDEVQIGKFRLVFLTGPGSAGACRGPAGRPQRGGLSSGAGLSRRRPECPDPEPGMVLRRLRHWDAGSAGRMMRASGMSRINTHLTESLLPIL